MSLFRVSLVIALLGLLSACGWQPLYGERTHSAAVQEKLAAIYIEPIRGRTQQILRNELLDLMTPKGYPAKALYHLNISVETQKVGLAIQQDDTKTRYNLNLTSRFQLIETATNKVIYSGSTQNVAAYNVVQSEFANLSAENNAEKRAALVAAEQINQQLSVFFSGR